MTPEDLEYLKAAGRALSHLRAKSLFDELLQDYPRLLEQRNALLAAAKAWEAHLVSTFPHYAPGTGPSEKLRDAIDLCEKGGA